MQKILLVKSTLDPQKLAYETFYTKNNWINENCSHWFLFAHIHATWIWLCCAIWNLSTVFWIQRESVQTCATFPGKCPTTIPFFSTATRTGRECYAAPWNTQAFLSLLLPIISVNVVAIHTKVLSVLFGHAPNLVVQEMSLCQNFHDVKFSCSLNQEILNMKTNCHENFLVY